MSKLWPNGNQTALASRARSGFVLWLAVIVLLSTALLWRIGSGLHIETSIIGLLSSADTDTKTSAVSIAQSSKFNSQMVFLVGHAEEEKALQAGEIFAAHLKKSNLFDEVVSKINFAANDLKDLYFPFRYQLLDPDTRKLLAKEGGLAKVIEQTKTMLYAPLGGLSSSSLAHDPLLLFPRFLQTLPALPENAYIKSDSILVKEEGLTYQIITASLSENPFEASNQTKVLESIELNLAALEEAVSQSVVLYTGIIRFAADGAQRMEREGMLIGWGSLLCILLLLVGTFRSLRQLLLSILSVGTGLLTAVVFSSLFFSKMHLLALVFGASLTGICIDYSVHYFAIHRLSGASWEPRTALRMIFPGITLGAFTSILGFAGLTFSDFPGLQQIALFSSFGILGAYFTVICCFPLMLKQASKAKEPVLFRLAGKILNLWNSFSPRIVFLVVVVLGTVLLLLLKQILVFDDNVSLLQKVSPVLVANEVKIRKLAGGFEQGKFFVVEGRDKQQVLERLEALGIELNKHVEAANVATYISLANFVPSIKKQKKDHALLLNAVREDQEHLDNYFSETGFTAEVKEQLLVDLAARSDKFLVLEDWLKTSISGSQAAISLNKGKAGYFALLPLKGVKNEPLLIETGNTVQGATYINVVDEINVMMKNFREQAIWLVLVSYFVILLVLILRYGLKGGMAVMAPPVLAALLALLALSLSGEKLNVVHTVSLLLVLAVGIDYPIFFAEQKAQRQETMFVVILCAFTTTCSFGLMALSNIPILHSFGFILITGVLSALLLAPLPVLFFSNKALEDKVDALS